jgi:hypothetical protein
MSGVSVSFYFAAPLTKAGNLIYQFCWMPDFIVYFDL